MNVPSPALYHVAAALYAPGESIAPGNYGRVVEGSGLVHGAFGREYLLEHMRVTEFSDKPSRLRSCFALEDPDRAHAFRQLQEQAAGGRPHNLYVVHLEDPGAATARVDMSWLDPGPMRSVRTIVEAEAWARAYWQRDLSAGVWEVLTAGALIVDRRLT